MVRLVPLKSKFAVLRLTCVADLADLIERKPMRCFLCGKMDKCTLRQCCQPPNNGRSEIIGQLDLDEIVVTHIE